MTIHHSILLPIIYEFQTQQFLVILIYFINQSTTSIIINTV